MVAAVQPGSRECPGFRECPGWTLGRDQLQPRCSGRAPPPQAFARTTIGQSQSERTFGRDRSRQGNVRPRVSLLVVGRQWQERQSSSKLNHIKSAEPSKQRNATPTSTKRLHPPGASNSGNSSRSHGDCGRSSCCCVVVVSRWQKWCVVAMEVVAIVVAEVAVAVRIIGV